MPNLSCFDVAKYILTLNDAEAGDLISNLKLQKLVYYSQGFSLAILDNKLFDQKIEAWMHGPVIPELYEEYKKYGSEAIPTTNIDLNYDKFSSDECTLLNDVFETYGQYSAWKLRNLTHEDPTWKNAYNQGKGAYSEISIGSMREYFLTQVE